MEGICREISRVTSDKLNLYMLGIFYQINHPSKCSNFRGDQIGIQPKFWVKFKEIIPPND